jgi:hypothetical protein
LAASNLRRNKTAAAGASEVAELSVRSAACALRGATEAEAEAEAEAEGESGIEGKSGWEDGE